MPNGLLILDDFFPNLLTGFRVAEYNAYFEQFPELVVLSANPDFPARHAEYALRYPQYASRVRPFEPAALAGCRLAYLNFLNNTAMFLPHLEALGIPFLLTLYPGGGLGLNDAASDAKLLTVLRSALLRGLVVTVPLTRDYVLDFMHRHALAPKPVHLVRGVVVNPAYFAAPPAPPQSQRREDPIRVCFVAEKYMEAGRNKGYPDFIEAATALHADRRLRPLALQFHVVGSFSAEDVDVAALEDRIHFHGRLETSELRAFLGTMDLLVSPNLPWLLHAGNFDGFPTGAAVEASLCGVALMLTDPLRQNPGYVDGKSYWLIRQPGAADHDSATLAQSIVAAMADALGAPGARERLARVGQAGRETSEALYSPDYQIGVRAALLQATLQALKASAPQMVAA